MEARRRAPGRPRGHPVLPADGRARRAARHRSSIAYEHSSANVAVVAFAQAPIVARDEHRTAHGDALPGRPRRRSRKCGVERDAIDYQIAGSDRLHRRPAVRLRRRARRDGLVAAARRTRTSRWMRSFAAYYAWLRIQAGEVDTAHGLSGTASRRKASPTASRTSSSTRTTRPRSGSTPTSTSALQASAYMARTRRRATRTSPSVAARNRAAGREEPDCAAARRAATADELAADAVGGRAAPRRLRAADRRERRLPRARRRGQGREACASSPAWIHGVDQRAEMQTIGARDLTQSASDRRSPRRRRCAMAGLGSAREARRRRARTPRTRSTEMILRDALGLDPRGGRTPAVNPSGGPLCGHPIMMTGLIRLGEVFRQLSGGAGERAVAGARRAHRARDAGPLPAAEPRLGARHRAEVVMKRPVAVVGVGQTQHAARRSDVSIPGLVREAVDRALADAGLEHKDIDAVVIGKAPDMLEGVDAARAVPRRRARRAHEADDPRAHRRLGRRVDGAHGRRRTSPPASSSACSRSRSRSSPKATRCGRSRRTCRSRRRSSPAPAASSRPTAAPTSQRTGCPPHIGPMIAANARDNATRNEYAHLREPMTRRGRDEVADALGSDPLRRDVPVVRRRDRDGDRRTRSTRRRGRGSPRGSSRRGVLRRGDVGAGSRPGRSRAPAASARRRSTTQAGITRSVERDPDRRDLRAVLVVRGDVAREPRLLRRSARAGRSSTAASRSSARTCRSTRRAACSCTNPIGASGMLRLGEAALQVMGRAGAHQVEGAKNALGHAYGGGAQYFAMWVVSTELTMAEPAVLYEKSGRRSRSSR